MDHAVTRVAALLGAAIMALACGVTALATMSCAASGGGEDERSVPAPQRMQSDGTIKLSKSDRTALGLAVAAATEDTLPDAVLRFGVVVVRPADDAPVIAPVTGRIARAPLVRLGESVRAGAPVVEIMPVLDAPDRISVGTQSAEREGQIEAARRELARAEAERDRARTLAPQVVSVAKLQEAEATAAGARARLEGLEQARSVSSGVQTKAVSAGAPIAGTIAALTASVGASVRTGDALGRVLRRGPIWVDVAVPPDEPPGDRYEVISAGKPLPARLLVRGAITETDGSRHDRIQIEDAADATQAEAPPPMPGASVTVRVARGSSRGTILPESAIVPGLDADTVFVETTPSIFASRPVHVAARFGERVRVTGGIKPGDRVVVQGAMALYGERVRAQLQPS